MSTDKKESMEQEPEAVLEENTEAVEEMVEESSAEAPEAAPVHDEMAALNDKYLRICAEYDNFRRRSQKEREALYGEVKADTAAKFLPVYDNLERALNQPTEDAAYKKGVEMTMTQLVSIFNGLGVEIFGQVGEVFDPNIHNAVMHTEEEGIEENTITQVFQKGFKMGDKIVRFAMVQVAN